MTTDDEITIDEVCKYVLKMQPYYERANQARKGQSLDEMEAITSRHRKSLIRLLDGPL